MEMIQKDIVTLLRSAVTGEALPLSDEFDLEKVTPYIRKHHILPLVYEGARLCGVTSPAMTRLFAGYCRAVQVSEGQMAELEKLFRAFEEAGIDYMPLKGSRMKCLYPKPELRMMGDADVLIRLEQYDRIVPIMESFGYEMKGETDHELIWQNQNLFLELHKRVMTSYNKDFYRVFGNGWQLAKEKTGHYFQMAAEDEWVYLFTHFAKHFRGGGIGFRHVLDLWIYLRANNNMDEAYIEKQLEALGLMEFYRNILRLVKVWFEDGTSDEVVELIGQFVMDSGSFGNDQNRKRGIALRQSKGSVFGAHAKWAYIWNRLFPPLWLLKNKYTVLQKAPWLLPVIWLIRPFYKLLFERRSLNTGQHDLEMLDEESMLQHYGLLKKMGIDYHF